MGDEYSYIGAVVGATYPEVGKSIASGNAKELHPGTWFMVHRVEKVRI